VTLLLIFLYDSPSFFYPALASHPFWTVLLILVHQCQFIRIYMF